MNILLLCALSVIEIAFLFLAVQKKPAVKEWFFTRLLVNGGEVLVFLVMLPLPGIDLGMRFGILFFFLGIRAFLAAVLYFMKKKGEKEKKSAGMVFSFLGSLLLFVIGSIPSFLFTDYEGLPATGQYEVEMAQAILVDEGRLESFETDESKREVPAYFFYPRGGNQGEKYPMVFFSHGAFGYYQSNTSTYMNLASHGYVVVSLEHPYHSLFTKDTYGKLILSDGKFMQGIQKINGTEASEEMVFALSSEWIKLRLEDSCFAIDKIKKAAKNQSLADCFYVSEKDREGMNQAISMIDGGKIGFMGHSLGGAAAVTIGRQREDIGAVVDFDGTMLGEIKDVVDGKDIINEDIYDTPLLSFDNEEHYKSRAELSRQGVPYANNVVLAHAKNGYSTYIAGTGHMNYTDLPLFSPFLANMLGTGDVDAEECVLKMNEITLQFFDCYLKDVGEFQVEEGYFLQDDGN
ncbi:MAG: hypothetical protein K2P76_15860 [Lachnospiraceae bacterium]|nr:hypothetical protein [Lachnospiraceae bacterium]MDE6982314.1 hypothetical protein [Lachnospiraceae bacterium]